MHIDPFLPQKPAGIVLSQLSIFGGCARANFGHLFPGRRGVVSTFNIVHDSSILHIDKNGAEASKGTVGGVISGHMILWNSKELTAIGLDACKAAAMIDGYAV